MEATFAALTSAIITGVVGPVLTLVIQKKIQEADFPTASKERLKRLKGQWYGRLKQVTLNGESTNDVLISVNNNGKVIQGEGKYSNAAGEKVNIILYNGIFDGNVLKIEYKNELGYVFQKGSIVLVLNARGNELNGKFVGYSPEQKQVISGEIYCSSQPIK